VPFSIVQVQGRLALTDDNGNVLGVFDDSGDKRLQVQAMLKAGHGLATENTLALIKSTDGIKKIVDALPAGTNNIGDVDIASALPAGTNEIGKVAQGTKGASANAWPMVLYDVSGNAVGVMADGTLYRLQTQAAITQLVLASTSNNSETPLGALGVFVGEGESTLNVAGIQVNVFSDQDSLPDGLIIQQSIDNVNWDITDAFTVKGTVGIGTTVQATASYFRIIYQNGHSAQGVFRLQVAMCPTVEVLPRSLGPKESQMSLSVTMAKDQAPIPAEDVRSLGQIGFLERACSELSRIRVLLECLTDEQINETDVETRD
jgi:hypothetical protein